MAVRIDAASFNVAPLFFFVVHLLISQFLNNSFLSHFLSVFFTLFAPSFPPSLALPGVVAMAREPAQMAGQLAFRGRAPQLKLPQFFCLFFFAFLQLKLLACNFSCLACVYLTEHDVRGVGGGEGGWDELSSDQ